VIAGYGIGLIFGLIYYLFTEPARPTSRAARLRTALLDSNIARYWRIRDGWAVYPDGGVEEEWTIWRKKYDVLASGLKAGEKHD
jgi:dolichyldiphosphatase